MRASARADIDAPAMLAMRIQATVSMFAPRRRSTSRVPSRTSAMKPSAITTDASHAALIAKALDEGADEC